ncbi:hypothetical protein [Streptomyces sp. NPDC060322]|uniref:hypothetical protein n=1 Tax=Streptomyces sp. NPDC060322 TaxID=3347097 RepID=UPI00365C41E3
MRELIEECDQVPDEGPAVRRYAEFVLLPEQQRKSGALFTRETSPELDFNYNGAFFAVRWVTHGYPLPGTQLDSTRSWPCGAGSSRPVQGGTR